MKRFGVSSHLVYGLHPLIGVLREGGIDHLPLLEKAGIAFEVLDNPEHRLSPQQELTFTELAINAIDEPDLGLLIGNRYHLSNYGVLGLAAMTSANLLEGLAQFTKYYLMTWTYFSFSIEEEGEQVVLEAKGQRDLGHCYRYLADRDLCATYTIAKEALGEVFPLQSVSFTHEKPDSTHRYEEVFQCPVRFGAKRNAVYFARKYLSRPLAQSEPEACRVFEKQCIKLCENLRKSTSLSELIRQHLLQEPNRVSSLEMLAERFHASPRSIQRKLTAEGTSYKDLLDDVRKNLAIEYLKTTSLPLTEIAVRLGYSEAPNFSNAFKRWTGKTPGEFRQSAQ